MTCAEQQRAIAGGLLLLGDGRHFLDAYLGKLAPQPTRLHRRRLERHVPALWGERQKVD
jgi:hypothetical protein